MEAMELPIKMRELKEPALRHTGVGAETNRKTKHLSVWEWALHGIGALLLLYILTRMNLRKIGETLARQNILLSFAALCLFVPLTLLRNWRWRSILRWNGKSLPFSLLYVALLESIFWGSVTPGRIGDYSRVLVLRREGCSWGLGLGVATFDRLLDGIVVFCVGLVCAVFVGAIAISKALVWVVSFVLILIAAGAAVAFRHRWKGLLRAIPVPKTYRVQLGSQVSEFLQVFVATPTGGWVILVAGTSLIQLLNCAEIYIFARNLGIGISFLYMIVMVSCASLVSLIPITFSGIGTRDAVFIVLLAQVGFSPEKAVALSTMVLFTFVFNSFLSYVVVVIHRTQRRS
jgi:hypothetical protein